MEEIYRSYLIEIGEGDSIRGAEKLKCMIYESLVGRVVNSPVLDQSLRDFGAFTMLAVGMLDDIISYERSVSPESPE